MFHDIPQSILDQMARLEAVDVRDRQDGTPRSRRLRQIPPETGKFLALLAASAPKGMFLEIGTSAAYSSLYLALACREVRARLLTFEILEEKARLARETIEFAGIDDVVQLVVGDARDHLPSCSAVAFCFLDAEKEIYLDCYDLVVPRMLPGGLLVADNVISHAEALEPFVSRALADQRLDSLIVPIGKGMLVCRVCTSKRSAVPAPQSPH